MRAYPEAYLKDVVENQGKLFDLISANYPEKDTSDFINMYMRSKTRKNIDEAMAYVNTMSAPELWDYFCQREGFKLKDGKAIEGFMPDWIGEFYAYYQWYYNIPSSEIVKSVPVDFLVKAYGGLHDLELELAVKKVGITMNIICFHNPNEENGYMSNWYPSQFTVDGVSFSSMEQFMMYKKAMCFGDKSSADKILETDDAARIKKVGRLVSNYDENHWNGVRQIIVYEGLKAKFSQNDELKEQLKATKNAILAECAVKDTIWGIGLSMNDPDRLEISRWKGKNLLGYALMMVRGRL